MGGKRQGLTVNTKLLIEFLVGRAKYLIVIEHPFSVDTDITPRMELYSGARLVETRRFPVPRWASAGRGSKRFYYATKLLDFVSSIYLVIRARRRVDLYVGTEVINALAGILLRKVGMVRSVIYDAFDYWPGMHFSPLNAIFLKLDRFCQSRADVVWELDESIAEMKDRITGSRGNLERRIIPPLNPAPDRGNFTPRGNNWIAFLGSLDRSLGIEIILGAMPIILQRIPGAVLHVIGTGPEMDELLKFIEDQGIKEKVFLHGFLPDDEAVGLLRKCKIGVAPYLRQENGQQQRFFFPSKVRYYITLGLPVVLSSAVPQSSEIMRTYKIGLLASPDPASFARSTAELLSDQSLYQNSLEGCFQMADSFNSDKIYEKAFGESIARISERRSFPDWA